MSLCGALPPWKACIGTLEKRIEAVELVKRKVTARALRTKADRDACVAYAIRQLSQSQADEMERDVGALQLGGGSVIPRDQRAAAIAAAFRADR